MSYVKQVGFKSKDLNSECDAYRQDVSEGTNIHSQNPSYKMQNFYITISNGLLKDEHRKRMGTAVWEFMWCLDTVTKIDSKGVGWVLGGKPVKLSEIGMGSSDDTVSRNLARLQEQGYVTVIRTPHGLSLRVHKAKKRFYKNAVSEGDSDPTKMRNHSAKMRNHSAKMRYVIKTVAVDSNNKTKNLPLTEKQMKALEAKKEEIRKIYGKKS